MSENNWLSAVRFGPDGLVPVVAQERRSGDVLMVAYADREYTVTTASTLLTFFRWYILVRAQGLPFTPLSALRLGSIGFALSTFMPGSVGGDIIKAFAIAREQSRRTVGVATVILDRVIGLCGLFWLVTLLGSIMDFSGIHDEAALTPQARTVLRGILITAAALSFGSLVFWFVMGFFSEAGPKLRAICRASRQ